MDDLSRMSWPVSRLGEGLRALAQACRLTTLAPGDSLLTPPEGVQHDRTHLRRWIELSAGALGVEAEPAVLTYGDLPRWLQHAPPALLRLSEDQFLLIAGRGKRAVPVLCPDLSIRRLDLQTIVGGFTVALEAPLSSAADALWDEVPVNPAVRQRAAAAIRQQRLHAVPIENAWVLRLSPQASIWQHVRQAGLLRLLLMVLALHVGVYLVVVISWGMAGQAALAGRTNFRWWILWAVLFCSVAPLRIFRYWLVGVFNVKASVLLKRRLLVGALQFEPDEIRYQGIGQLLGRVNESETLEGAVLNNGLYGLLAVVELVMGFVILASGAGGLPHALVLLLWVLGIVGVAILHYRRRRAWTELRRDLTHDLVEKMVGYRTRLAQEPPEHWHRGEDSFLERYLRRSQASDTTQTLLTILLQRGWFVVGLLGLVPALIRGAASVEQIAVSVGGVIFIAQVLDWKFIPNVIGLIDAAVVWSQVAPVFHAAARTRPQGSPSLALSLDEPHPHPSDGSHNQPLVELHDVTFRYHPQGPKVLDAATLQIDAGDRLLLEGPSGSGKSTLAAVLVGLRSPTSGSLRLRGLDQTELGAAQWRRRLVAAPQFQENHILSETLLFNLLMGRRWPPSQADVDRARLICGELGLEELIDRMPGGIFQWVGDTGWQLSHGERSRIYIARALLQNADLIVLDESFAALDPENLRNALECALRHAKTLLVIAHP